ncbi:response regulator [Arcobacter sp. HD9-500m-PIT-SAG03]|nr:response regulator [Arcobacter sp. HD9-500m-PIT-SAG03]
MTKIAIIDDEIQILQSIQRYLGRRKQFDITIFDNPTHARKSLLNAEYDLIMMPQINGIDMLKELRKEDQPR